MKRVRRLLWVIFALLFVVGAELLAYPFLNGAKVDSEIKEEAHSFLTSFFERESTEQALLSEEAPTEPEREYPALWNAMQEYNELLYTTSQTGLCDPWSYQQPSFALQDYGITDEKFGVISIPAISLEMPIYLGATGEHMALGAAHLSQTSLPIGGNHTNSVIAGHRGYNGASYFRYITDLRAGDMVMITNLWQTLYYRVCGAEIIDPNQVDAIHIQPGRDMITLLTCHPYASGGKQRYLVFCERVEMPEGTIASLHTEETENAG